MSVIADFTLDKIIRLAGAMDIDKVKTVLLETAAAHTLVLKNPAPNAFLEKNSDSSLIFSLRVWCNNTDWWTVYVNSIESVKKAFDKNGIVIAFPQFDIHMDPKK